MLNSLLETRWICMKTCMFEMLLSKVRSRDGSCIDCNLGAMFFSFTQILLWVSVPYGDLPSSISSGVIYIRNHILQGLEALLPVATYWMWVLPKCSGDQLVAWSGKGLDDIPVAYQKIFFLWVFVHILDLLIFFLSASQIKLQLMLLTLDTCMSWYLLLPFIFLQLL